MTGITTIGTFLILGGFLLAGCKSDDPAANVDRMGRAGVNTAVTDPFFDPDVPSQQASHEAVQDDYNAARNPRVWVDRFAPDFAGNVAIFDGLDLSCGNQLLAGPDPVPGRYDALAEVLADDRIFVNTDSGTCEQYLAVEANAVGIPSSDCGGRTPLYDTIDTTYSVLAAGIFVGVTDGVSSDVDGAASLTDFPFLTAPN